MTRERLIAATLVRHDPQGLIRLGASSDEYDSEAIIIDETWRKAEAAGALSLSDLNDIVYRAFLDQFESALSGPVEHYREIARELLAFARPGASA